MTVCIVERAELFATERHEAINHVRKYTGLPYITHPRAVASIVATVPHSKAQLAAAWLHDTVEDTETTIEEIESEFGIRVASYVDMLTDISKPEDGNRAQRKAIDRAHDARALPEVKTVRLADCIHNMSDVQNNDPEFAKVYMKEKALLIEVLKDGDPSLWDRANAMITSYFENEG